jgi:hypothetical protein
MIIRSPILAADVGAIRERHIAFGDTFFGFIGDAIAVLIPPNKEAFVIAGNGRRINSADARPPELSGGITDLFAVFFASTNMSIFGGTTPAGLF